MGETRINLLDIFSNLIEALPKDASEIKFLKNDPKFFKLYSSQLHQSFVTGTISLGFELYGSKPKKKGLKSILSKSRSRSDVSLNGLLLNVNLSAVRKGQITGPTLPSVSNVPTAPKEEVVVVVPTNNNEMISKWTAWTNGLTSKDTAKPNEQGFYASPFGGDPVTGTSDGEINKTLQADYDYSDGNRVSYDSIHSSTVNNSPYLNIPQKSYKLMGLDNESCVSTPSDTSSVLSDISGDYRSEGHV